MRQRISESFRKICERGSVGASEGKPQDGFAKAVYAIGGDFEGKRGGIVGSPCDHHLHGMAREKKRSQAVRRGEESVLRRDSREGFQRFLCEIVVTLVTGEGVHANQRHDGDGVRAGGGRILERFAAYVQPTKRRWIVGPVKKSAGLPVRVQLENVIRGALSGAKIARVQRRFVGG